MAEWIMKEEKDMDGVDCYIKTGEIIRCRECKHCTPVTAHCEIRGKGLFLIRGMDDFCSRAERKENR